MKFNEWNKVKLGEVIQFNPPETLKKGTIAKKVGMDKLAPYQKKINGYECQEYKGGVKFRNGDTLFARITPSLENGKTAQVDILDKEEIGFGSTEFIVWREKEGKTINDFIYYLSISPEIRDVAIKSMTGTSGRQRVQLDALKNHTVILPPVEEQKAIADFLSSLDKKIEVNNQISAVLEKIAHTIFKHWFIDFEFPDEKGNPYRSSGGEFVLSESIKIPIGWKFRKLNEVVNIKYGKNLPTKNLLDNGFPVFGGNGKIGYFNEYLYEKPQVLVACRGAASGKVLTSLPYSFVTNNSLVLEYENGPLTFEYLKYYCLQNPFFQYVTGSAQPQITITNISNAPILIPNKTVLLKYSQIVKSIEEKILLIKKENKYLSNIRDTLLPKLMSGEIRVPVESD